MNIILKMKHKLLLYKIIKIGIPWSRYTVEKQFNNLKIGNQIIIQINRNQSILSYFFWKSIFYFHLIYCIILDKFIATVDGILFGFKNR